MHRLYRKADQLSQVAIGSAIEVHRPKGPGLIEGICERCLMRELELRHVPAVSQRVEVEFCHARRPGSSCGAGLHGRRATVNLCS